MREDLSEILQPCDCPPLIYRSKAMAETISVSKQVAATDANILILGENGTGKGLVARLIHQFSKRVRMPFLSVDLGSISESVFESEMFGHEKGAFTSAQEGRKGRFRAATGGTLFLDEVANLSLDLQAKLLTALDQRHVTPVGADQPQAIDTRIVAATNCSPSKLADPSVFRTDLLFRLNTVEIYIPPLRERPDDIPVLLEHYLKYFSRRYNRPLKFVEGETYDALKSWAWPGNVRALRHAAERAVILSAGKRFGLDDFQLSPTSTAATHRHTLAEAVTHSTTMHNGDLNLSRLEQQAVKAALNRHQYNISHAAKDLGITRSTLYRRMEKFGL